MGRAAPPPAPSAPNFSSCTTKSGPRNHLSAVPACSRVWGAAGARRQGLRAARARPQRGYTRQQVRSQRRSRQKRAAQHYSNNPDQRATHTNHAAGRSATDAVEERCCANRRSQVAASLPRRPPNGSAGRAQARGTSGAVCVGQLRQGPPGLHVNSWLRPSPALVTGLTMLASTACCGPWRWRLGRQGPGWRRVRTGRIRQGPARCRPNHSTSRQDGSDRQHQQFLLHDPRNADPADHELNGRHAKRHTLRKPPNYAEPPLQRASPLLPPRHGCARTAGTALYQPPEPLILLCTANLAAL